MMALLYLKLYMATWQQTSGKQVGWADLSCMAAVHGGPGLGYASVSHVSHLLHYI